MKPIFSRLTALLGLVAGSALAQQPGATPPVSPALPAPARVEASCDDLTPVAIEAPCHIEAVVPEEFTARAHHYVLTSRTAGVHEMVVRFIPVDPASEVRLYVSLPDRHAAGTADYLATAGEFRFYPVLPADGIRITVTASNAAPGDRYTLAFAPDECVVPESLKTAAKTAIDRGSAWLLTQRPADLDYSRQQAIESLVLMALLGGDTPSSTFVRDYITWLAADRREPSPPGSWDGRPVVYFGSNDNLYDQSIIGLAAAEAVSLGIEEARPLAVAAQQFVLAAQLTERRCASWEPVPTDDTSHGGWRYTGNATDADISVTGWCMASLLAAEVAGVSDPGVRPSLRDGTRFVRRLFGSSGFGYTVESESGDVRNSIGAMVLLLMGEEGPDLNFALEVLDTHLPAGTQTVAGENFALYYAYYATRANFLRGGRPWERWRSIAMRQLTRLQRDDGSWPAFGNEASISDRYNAAMAVMILRICLEDVPAYMQQEMRGF
jgi:hypothetical protein